MMRELEDLGTAIFVAASAWFVVEGAIAVVQEWWRGRRW